MRGLETQNEKFGHKTTFLHFLAENSQFDRIFRVSFSNTIGMEGSEEEIEDGEGEDGRCGWNRIRKIVENWKWNPIT